MINRCASRAKFLPIYARCASCACYYLPITTRLYDIGGGYKIPVSCVDAAVLPGYAVLADASGVLFIVPDDLEQQIDIAERKTERGGSILANVATGEKLGTLSGASRMLISKK